MPIDFQYYQSKILDHYIDEVIFFRRYHQNYINAFIHAITIPLEWFSWVILISLVNIHWIIQILIFLYYVIIGTPSALVCSLLHLAMAYMAGCMQRHLGIVNSIMFFCLCQISAWISQVIFGHWLFERNQPAMVNRLTINSIILSVLLSWEWERFKR